MMKKGLLFALVLVLVIPISVQAASQRTIAAKPCITFTDSTANCTVDIWGNNMSDPIEATIKLWNGGICLKTWKISGAGYINFSETVSAAKGNTYTLTVDASINNVLQPNYSTTKTYQ